MKARLDTQKTSPAAHKAMVSLEFFIQASSRLEPSLIELVKMRASQIGCAFCIDMHSKDARAKGESEQRLYALSAWEETLPEILGATCSIASMTKGHS